MGRSKFPGKPSRLVIKDRIRVLHKNENIRKLNSKRKQENSSSCNYSVNSKTKKKKNFFQNLQPARVNIGDVQFNSGSNSSKYEIETTNDTLEENCVGLSELKDSTSDQQYQNKTIFFMENFPEALKANPKYVEAMKPKSTEKISHVKKKTVTFKNILETSDDKLMSRSIHNPLNKGPLVSIMKTKCIKPHRYIPRKDKIVRPSRLTKIPKNNANIDKTKFLSFRSVSLPMLNEENVNYSSACKLFLTGDKEKIDEPKLENQNEDGKNCEKVKTAKTCDQLLEKWNIQTLTPKRDNIDIKDGIVFNQDKHPPKKKENSTQIILRQPRLLFEKQDEIPPKSNQKKPNCCAKPYQEELNNNTEQSFGDPTACNMAMCGVCSTLVSYKNIEQSRKYGITACEFCRTFISKMTKKTIAASLNSLKAFKIQCLKNEGKCLISSLSKGDSYSFKKIFDERCSACWLKKCIKSFHFPPGHKLRLSSVISENQKKNIDFIDKSENTVNLNKKNHLSEKCDIESRPNFTWKWKNGINESEFRKQTQLDTNLIENLVNGNITTVLFSKAECSDRVNTTLNIILNKNSNEMLDKSLESQECSIPTSDFPKRQKIAFKGPRVKHVCRSASIALGQQMATFSNGNVEALQLLRCNSEIKNNFTNNLSQKSESKQIQIKHEKEVKRVENDDVRLTLESDFEVEIKNQNVSTDTKTLLNEFKNDHENLSHNCPRKNNVFDPIHDKYSESKNKSVRIGNVPQYQNKAKMISIDFWDTYAPAEVKQTGFGLILTKPTSASALCFLCGSMDLNDLLFCVCCCEPYHSYCVQEVYTNNTEFVDKKEKFNQLFNQLNWMCPRCTVCDTCNMSSGTKIKCQKCKKNYHTTCLGTSKGFLCADRPLICKSCLKCQFCAATKVSKYVGNRPTCIQCFMEKRSLSTCSLCQKCINNVLEVEILECGVCNEFLHAKCEGLSEEQTNLCSSISEDIKFVCNKCSLSNYQSKKLAMQWREAISKELKSRLLQVLKQLSKSQLADILKKSKKIDCNCSFDKVNQNQNRKEYLNECHKYNLNNMRSKYLAKCLCPKSYNAQLSNNFLSLLDIKKKILSGGYLTLFDFNTDMQDVIATLKNDELALTYKEIISETFSWFQNDTKTCTDALEEDMFDWSNYSSQTENVITEEENLLPKLPFSISDEKLFTLLEQNIDKRICIFCNQEGDGEILRESRLLYYGFDSWVHVNCALWSEDVYEEFDGSLQNVHTTFTKGRLIKCVVCGNTGATIKCNVKSCSNHYHFHCARKIECLFKYDTSIVCPLHCTDPENSKCILSNDVFCISRPLHIECHKSHKKYVEPFNVQFMLGSLSVLQLGSINLPFSDTSEAIVPINFICTRLYWSIKEPWKVIKYRVQTSIQNNSITFNNIQDRNFTVDHSKERCLIEKDLAQISYWHNTLVRDNNIKALIKDEHNYLNTLRFSKNVDYRTENVLDSFIEKESHNNSDILPPEIEKAIFEDLPKGILDGISMLDIFPKLIIHENFKEIDTKTENKNYATEKNVPQQSIDYYNSSLEKQDSKYFTQKRELQSNNSECPIRTDYDYRSEKISERKLKNDFFNLDFSKKMATHLKSVKSENRLRDNKFSSREHNLSEENKSFTQLVGNSIRLMQLDGADDHVAIYLGTKMQNTNLKTPVKCDRCYSTFRSFDSFQRHFVNCEQISTSENETCSPDFLNSIIVVKDELKNDNFQLYQNKLSRNRNVSMSLKQANNLNSFLLESDVYSNNSIPYVEHNILNKINELQDNINNNTTNTINSTTRNEHCKLYPKVSENTVDSPFQTSKTVNGLQETNNYFQLIDQNSMLNDEFTQRDQQSHQHHPFAVVQQSAGNIHPILVHQVPNAVSTLPQNMVPVVFSNNLVHNTSVPDFTNSLVPSTIWHSGCNIMLSPGLQMLPMPSMQLSSPSPPFVGSFYLPQSMQLGLSQVVLGGEPSMELMSNANHLLLTPQPVFYGLETIVQNTVMSSQQFFSTAVQGVLGQNASFSATTTQVFQSSKFEPVNDASSSFFVLNNVDGSTLVLPQNNILPGYLNNSTHDSQNSYIIDFGNLNRQDTTQQSKTSKSFPPIETLIEFASSKVKEPINDHQEGLVISPKKITAQSDTLTQNNQLLNADFLEVKKKCPEFGEIISKQKEETIPRNIKRKDNLHSFSQVCSKAIYKKNLKSKNKFNRLQSKATPVNISSSIKKRNYSVQNSRDSDESNLPRSILSTLKKEESVNTSLTKFSCVTPTSGGSLSKALSNKVSITQTKQCNKNITSRPTNRVLPMQLVHKPVRVKPTSSIHNEYFIYENDQKSASLETINNKLEYIKAAQKVLEAVKSNNKTDSSRNLLTKYLSTKQFTVHNTNNFLEEPDKNALDNQVLDKSFVDNPHYMKNKNMDSFFPRKKESILDSEKFNTPDSNDVFKIEPNHLNYNSTDKNSNISVEKHMKDLRLKKDCYEAQPSSKEKVRKYIFEDDQQLNVPFASKKSFKVESNKESIEPSLIFEIQSEDGFSYKSHSISSIWEKVFEEVQSSRRAYGLPSYSIETFADICGVQTLGLKTSALKYLIEQLPGAEKCQRYTPKYHVNDSSIDTSNIYTGYEMCSNSKYSTAARCETFTKRSSYDIFSWLASKHRNQPKQIFVQPSDTELIAKRCTANLPMAMKYRTLRETCKLNVGVFRSLIHGRGLFCVRDMEAGEMVIEYAGELIRSTVADKRERFYDNKEIGCYMFKIDEHFVVDATMRGNAARFINHSCEPNCFSKVVDILGHKHIIIFSLRRIVQGEELTYDYKFPFEDVKIHCYCASKKCRKYLN